MTLHTNRLGETVVRLLPFFTIAVVVTSGYFLFIQPRLGAYLRARTGVAAIEERAMTLQQAAVLLHAHQVG